MPRYIVRAKDPDTGEFRFAIWSTIVDAPVTPFRRRDDFLLWNQEATPDRMARVDAKGTSSLIHESAEEIMSHNRAGNGEKHLSPAKLVRAYRED